MKRLVLALMLILSAGSGAYADYEEGTHDWYGTMPTCC